MTKQSGIVRRPDFAGGGITEEERERMETHLALWIERAFRTEPADPQLIETAIKGLYRVANLAEPRVIVAPSPLVMEMAGVIAALWWYLFENNRLGDRSKRNDATDDAIRAATRDAIRAATRDEAQAATDLAHYAPIYNEIFEEEDGGDDGLAVYDEYNGVIYCKTRKATYFATFKATNIATDIATRDRIYRATGAGTYFGAFLAAHCPGVAAIDASLTN